MLACIGFGQSCLAACGGMYDAIFGSLGSTRTGRSGERVVACAAVGLMVAASGCVRPSRGAASAPVTTQWSYQGQEGMEVRTQNWIVYMATTRLAWLDRLGGFAEAAYGRYQELVPAPATSRHLTLYVFGDAVQWQDYGLLLGVPGNDVDVMGELTGFARKDTAAVYVSQYPSRTFSAIGHVGMLEYLWLHDAGDAPLWIREGLATLCEGFNEQKSHSLFAPGEVTRIRYVFDPKFNATRGNQLRAALQKNWLFGLDPLLTAEDFSKASNPPVAARTYQAELWGMMVFMQRHRQYRKGFEQMRLDLANGTFRARVRAYAIGQPNLTEGQAAFRLYITEDTGTFWRQFMKWVRRDLLLAD